MRHGAEFSVIGSSREDALFSYIARSKVATSRYLVLALLTGAYVLSVIDRGIISVVLTDVQNEFSLNDTQLALLGGTAFALFYATLGIPIARLADRSNRRIILAASIIVWSAATALSGVTAGFWSLFLTRVFVGAGEAGCTPTSHSLITDYFRKGELARALGVYSAGAIIGMLSGFLLGSVLAQHFGWRTVFIALGIPGLLFGAVVVLIVRDPRYDSPGVASAPPRLDVPLRESLGDLLGNPIYRAALFGHGFSLVCFYALFVWIYPLVERSFELSKTAIGQYTALALLFGAIPGMVLGGLLTDRMAAYNIRWRGWLPAFWVLVSTPLYYATLAADTASLLFIWFGLFAFCINMHHAAAFSIVQIAAKDHQRALAVAMVLLVSNLLGYAALPVVAGYLSDTVFRDMGANSIRYGLAVVGLASLVGTSFFLLAVRALGRQSVAAS